MGPIGPLGTPAADPNEIALDDDDEADVDVPAGADPDEIDLGSEEDGEAP